MDTETNSSQVQAIELVDVQYSRKRELEHPGLKLIANNY
jgi:hypothetical protein